MPGARIEAQISCVGFSESYSFIVTVAENIARISEAEYLGWSEAQNSEVSTLMAKYSPCLEARELIV